LRGGKKKKKRKKRRVYTAFVGNTDVNSKAPKKKKREKKRIWPLIIILLD
jgi:hypothetical protein